MGFQDNLDKHDELMGRIPRRIWRNAFCEKHQRNYQEPRGCFDCFMEQLNLDTLRTLLRAHEFVPAVSACSCHWVAEFGGDSSAWNKWIDHVFEVWQGLEKLKR